jgi:hypothetical protein
VPVIAVPPAFVIDALGVRIAGLDALVSVSGGPPETEPSVITSVFVAAVYATEELAKVVVAFLVWYPLSPISIEPKLKD